MLDVKLSLGVREGRHQDGGQDRGDDGGVGVHHCSLLGEPGQRGAGHEAGPEHPQEQGAEKGGEVGRFGGCQLMGLGDTLNMQGSAHPETEEGSKDVEEDRVTDIKGEQHGAADILIDREEHNLRKSISLLLL